MLGTLTRASSRTIRQANKLTYHSTTSGSAKWQDVEVPIGEEKWTDVTRKSQETTPKSTYSQTFTFMDGISGFRGGVIWAQVLFSMSSS